MMSTPDARLPLANSLSRERERAGVRVRARQLRQASTDAEAKLWAHLRDRRLQGWKFRRQHPVAGYFADFACLEAGLLIELDGGQHASLPQQTHDQRRSAALAAAGFAVLRFWNHEVLQQTEAVLQRIATALSQRAATLTPTLSRQRERAQDRKDET
ncbi:MAG: endonuclease domain-containing protein [Pseudomonadota bacterium]|nr:endonuclease domain-containing protein [Pseudomonadota bacterium]